MYKIIFRKIFIGIICLFVCQISIAQNWEVKLLSNINTQNPNSSFWKNTTSSTYPIAIAAPVSFLTIGYIKKDKALQQKAWSMVGSLAINTAITQGLKQIVKRERPYEKYPTLIFPDEYKSDYSFPSGHVSTAFATATSLSIACKKWYVVVPSFAWATGVAYSRMYLGQHYPTDVLAGALLGTGSALLSNWLTKKYFNQKSK